MTDLTAPTRPGLFASTPRLGHAGRTLFSMIVAGSALVGAPALASAQEATDTGAVSSTGKGIAGGALLGAELVMLPMGLAGVDAWWPYAVFAPVGAAGGAIGGWAIEQNVTATEPSLYLLAGGLALVIPTVIVTLDATTREHFDDESDPSTLVVNPSAEGTLEFPGATPPPGAQPAPAGGPAAPVEGAPGAPGAGSAPMPPGGPAVPPAAPAPGSSAPTSHLRPTRRRAPAPVAAVDVFRGSVRIGLPAVQVRNRFTQDEVQQFGVQQTSEFLLPVVKSTF